MNDTDKTETHELFRPDGTPVKYLAGCYGLQSGWTAVEDVVRATEDAGRSGAVERAGYQKHQLLVLENMCSNIAVTVYLQKREAKGVPRYYLALSFGPTVENLYASSLPAMLAFLKDFAPILQADGE
jgi:hypothetical protein